MIAKTASKLDIEYFKEFFYKLKNNSYFGRLGKTFRTEKNLYFLDTGTGKIARLNENVYKVLKCLLENDSFDSLFELNISEDNLILALNEIREAVEKEHILSAPILETLTGNPVLRLDEMLSNKIQNITLELTEKCNLRCKYCIYNPSHPEHREFGHRDMNFETAKKAIDFFNNHTSDTKEVYIGFYGGEPLLNFELLKKCIDYAKIKIKNKDLSYSMTTNATLITEDIANFLVENKVSITVSLDGPKLIHNENRVYANGKGSFDDTIRGLKNLVKAYKKIGANPSFGFNIVTSGPNYEEKYDQIHNFFKNLDWLPSDLPILCSTVDPGPKEMEYVLPQSKDEKHYINNIHEPLFEWSDRKKQKSPNEQLFWQGGLDKELLRIHKRLLTDKPAKQYGMNGCCVPGYRKMFVTVDGNFYPCERVGNVPSLGNVDIGLDIPKIKKIYVEDFINEAKKYCKNCWAVNLCSVCYTNSYDENGIHYSYRHEKCIDERISIESSLAKYHSIFENNPEELGKFNEMELT
ncbi:TPA: radical SAM protein [Clostridium botulinum]|uniref:radical SAM/SPASM domain-containing protein n=1 Tax=Clostridium botulinum TaxID=1491 RepID=UPI000D0D0CDD|nr:radical SAM protein [Clostridium botulinum]PSM03441.1 radical SAM protein [Clostridium botulinum]HDK7138550.1 radical SAM protein [Clostridium botulinum]HDK7141879.1 radical SAM protein [Clostridium botulinum]HDK7146305.1 radical SAM protein [Clostridium botulinum]HDK7150010.1 radical SAM protein [Clostridium botulinum]